ncbi:hypothetical protein LCGC14_0388010 [marine sediment metagenome]|uniref:Uncharacterized protein n=1 Tax=marine sediment metagenome TaxID=412755 RepID=A0A0F9T6D4_9ZZZZ
MTERLTPEEKQIVICGACDEKYDICSQEIKCPHKELAKAQNRPDSREKIAEKYWLVLREFSAFTCAVEWKDASESSRQECCEWADQLIALYPDVEELDRIRDEITRLNKKLDDREEDLIEAKREEKERIIQLFYNKLSEEYKTSYNTPACKNLLATLFDYIITLKEG